jgi:hypothetical protein
MLAPRRNRRGLATKMQLTAMQNAGATWQQDLRAMRVMKPIAGMAPKAIV